MIDEHATQAKDKPVIRIKGIRKGDRIVRLVSFNGFVNMKAPDDGYVVEFYEGSASVPIYVRVKDLQNALQARDFSGESVYVDVPQW